ncbi:hypothetical protein TURU_124509 [Turdus rufiventris]|nr:hypothetical protein TURU_124509 [Turdus rufiventris]
MGFEVTSAKELVTSVLERLCWPILLEILTFGQDGVAIQLWNIWNVQGQIHLLQAHDKLSHSEKAFEGIRNYAFIETKYE